MTFNLALHGLRGLAALLVLLFHWNGTFPILGRELMNVPWLGTQ